MPNQPPSVDSAAMPARLSRRALLAQAATAAVAAPAGILLAACGSGTPTPAGSSAAPGAVSSAATSAPSAPQAASSAASGVAGKAAGQVSLILFDNYWTNPLKAMIAKYKAETGVEVVLDNPPLAGFYQKQLSLSLAKEKKPDILAANDTILSQYAGSGLLEPLDDYLKDASLAGKDYNWEEFPEQMRRAAAWSATLGQAGKVYGLPIEFATWGYFYRSDLIDKPPETFAEYVQISRQFTQSTNPKSPTKYGTVIQGKQLPPQYKEWYIWLWAYGGELFDQKLNPLFTSFEAVKSLEDDYNLLLKDKATPPDTVNYHDDEKTAALQNEVIAHLMHWTHQFSVYSDPKRSPRIAGKIKYTMVPGMPGKDGKVQRFPYAQQWMLCLNPNSDQKQQAFKFIAWLTSPAGTKAWAEEGHFGVARPTALKDPDLQKKVPSFQVSLEAQAIGRYGPSFFKEYAQIADSKLLPALSKALAGTQTPRQALESVQKDATDILKNAGYLK